MENLDSYKELFALQKDEVKNTAPSQLIEKWYNELPADFSARGFDFLAKNLDSVELVSCLCEKYFFENKMLADKIFGADSIRTISDKEIKTIGIFYPRYGIGGVERVISILMPLYIKMGYNVVLFTDEISKKEYEIPPEVTRIVLPSSIVLSKEEYRIRASEFLKYLKNHNVDLMCYHGATGMMLFDMLLLKLNNIPVVVTSHLFALHDIVTLNDKLCVRPSIFRLADCVTVLSKVDEMYYKNLGINAIYLQNPLVGKIINRDLTKIEKNTLVWVGRLDYEKRCLDIPEIMSYVVQAIPNVKIFIVGNEYSKGIKNKLEQKIKKFGLEKNILLCGATTKIESYYEKSELLLFTSVCESFAMVIAEAKSFGLPTVMYELPFLELCRDKKGILDCPQGDVKKAGENIVKILTNEELKIKLQGEAIESIKPFYDFDLEKSWKNLFGSVTQNKITIKIDESVNIMLRSFLQNYSYGVLNNKCRNDSNSYFFCGLIGKLKNGIGFLKRNGLKVTIKKAVKKFI